MTTKNLKIRDQLKLDVTPQLHEEIRQLWKKHSIAEDARNIPGLLSTLTPDCVYEIHGTPHRWVGHEGATQFYTSFLAGFPDIHFDLQNIVIGPQGVFEEAIATGTHQGAWIGEPPTGKKVRYTVLILFPWDPVQRKFSGERVYRGLDFGTPVAAD